MPFLLLLLGAILCLVVDAATDKNGSRRFLPIIAGAAIIASMGTFLVGMLPQNKPFIEDTFFANEFGQLGCLVILFASLVQTIMAPRLIEQRNLPSGEFYSLILFAALGMVLLAVSNELLTAFIALEIMSLSLYVLTGIDRRSGSATEASFKYFILGSFASAFLVLGIAFLFGATETTYITEMGRALMSGGASINPVWLYVGFALVFVGGCFKLSLAPFHMWAPDVYQGANTPTAMVIATGSKIAALAFIASLIEALSLWKAFGGAATFIIGFVAIVSMLWGNLAALIQVQIKRMLAYSSVAHTGYVAVGLVVLAALPNVVSAGELPSAQSALRNAMIFYMAGYTLMNVLAFGIAFMIGGDGHMGAWRGLWHRRPVAALAMAVTMFSLLGIPPTVGFMGKFYLFQEAVKFGFVPIVVIAVLCSVISAFYYLNLVVTMFMREEEAPEGIALAGGRGVALAGGGMITAAVLAVSFALVFIFGILPMLFFSLKLGGS